MGYSGQATSASSLNVGQLGLPSPSQDAHPRAQFRPNRKHNSSVVTAAQPRIIVSYDLKRHSRRSNNYPHSRNTVGSNTFAVPINSQSLRHPAIMGTLLGSQKPFMACLRAGPWAVVR